MTMRPTILIPILLLGVACGQQPATHGPAPETDTTPAVPQAPAAATDISPSAPGLIELHALKGSNLRFDGVYGHAVGNIHYFMRFFERGNVALIAGRQEPTDPVDLRGFLTQDAQSGVNQVHNVPVTARNDSLFFTTMALRGAITYAGVAMGDSVRFLKHSKITGRKEVITYRFQPY